MIGAEPNSGWLYGTVKLDKKGFVLTGGTDGFESTPYATSVPGMYAVGDVRASSVKRVASAVGEGSVVLSDVHRYLADHRNHLGVEPESTLAALREAGAAKEALTNVYGFLAGTVGGNGQIRFVFHPLDEADVPAAISARYTPEFVHWCFAQNSQAN